MQTVVLYATFVSLLVMKWIILLQDQLRRYIEIKQSDLPSAVAAKKTREFRCPPREQVSAVMHVPPMLYFYLPNIVALCYIKQTEMSPGRAHSEGVL